MSSMNKKCWWFDAPIKNESYSKAGWVPGDDEKDAIATVMKENPDAIKEKVTVRYENKTYGELIEGMDKWRYD